MRQAMLQQMLTAKELHCSLAPSEENMAPQGEKNTHQNEVPPLQFIRCYETMLYDPKNKTTCRYNTINSSHFIPLMYFMFIGTLKHQKEINFLFMPF